MMQRYVSEEFVMVRRRRINYSAIAQDAIQFAVTKIEQAKQAIGSVAKFIRNRIFTPAQRAVNCVRKHAYAIGAATCIGVMAAIATYQSLVG